MFFRPISAAFLIAAFLPVFAQANVNWNEILNQDAGATVYFGAGHKGLAPFRRNFEVPMAPASTSKVFTAGALLAARGKNFRYPTILRWRESSPGVADELTLIGSGDPSWGMPQFGEKLRTRIDQIAEALKNAGVRIVRGELILVSADPRWESFIIPRGWKEQDTLSCGGSLAFGFNLNLNCATFRLLNPGKGAWLEQGLSSPVELRVKEGNKTGLIVRLVKNARGPRFVISGTLKKGETRSFTLPVFDPSSWAKALFRQALVEKGIRLAEEIPENERGVEKELTFYSRPLSELLKPFLKNSVNFLGDAFLKSLAMNHAGVASDLLNPGLLLLTNYLNRLGLPRDFVIHDGSGLSRNSRVSPKILLEFLEHLQREPYFPTILEALAVAGIDGTLRNRMKGSAAVATLRGKTGTLDGVYNLAGYVPWGRDHVPFVMLSRTTSDKSAIARKAEDRVGIRLALLHKPANEPLATTIEPFPYVPEQAGMDDQ